MWIFFHRTVFKWKEKSVKKNYLLLSHLTLPRSTCFSSAQQRTTANGLGIITHVSILVFLWKIHFYGAIVKRLRSVHSISFYLFGLAVEGLGWGQMLTKIHYKYLKRLIASRWSTRSEYTRIPTFQHETVRMASQQRTKQTTKP